MSLKAIIIEDPKEKIFFGYIQQIPCVCAQGESGHEVMDKINIFFSDYLHRLRNEKIEVGPIETLILP